MASKTSAGTAPDSIIGRYLLGDEYADIAVSLQRSEGRKSEIIWLLQTLGLGFSRKKSRKVTKETKMPILAESPGNPGSRDFRPE